MVMVVLEYFPTVLEISGVELRSSSVPIPQVAITTVEHLEIKPPHSYYILGLKWTSIIRNM